MWLIASKLIVLICIGFNLILLAHASMLIIIGSRSIRHPVEKATSNLQNLSVIIAAKEEGHILPYTLVLLLNRLEYPRDKTELIVAVDEGDNETLKACQGLDFVKVVLVQNPLGKPKALNEGLKASKGELILVMDADSVMERGAVLKMLSLMDDPSIGGVGAVPHPLNISEGLLPLIFAVEVKLWEKLMVAKDSLGLFVQAPGSLSLLKRFWVEKVGGWCDRCIAEDNELSARIFCKGGRIRLSTVKVGVEAPTSIRTLIRQRFRWYRGTFDALRLRLGFRDVLRLGPAKCIDLVLSFSSPLGPAAFLPVLLYSLVINDVVRLFVMFFLLVQLVLASSASRGLSPTDRLKVLGATIPYVMLNSLVALAAFFSLFIPIEPKWTRTEKVGEALRRIAQELDEGREDESD